MEDRKPATRIRSLLVALFLLVGCQSGPESLPGASGPIERLIADPSEGELVLSDLRTTSSVFSLDLNAGADDAWRVVGSGSVEVENGHLHLNCEANFVAVMRAVDWDADAFDVLNVSLDGPGIPDDRIRFFWSGPGTRISDERTLAVAVGQEGEVTFELERHPLWSGRVTTIRLDVPCRPGGNRDVTSIQTLRYEYEDAGLAPLGSGNVKVEVESDLRSSAVSTAGHPLTWQLPQEKSKGELRFSYSLLGQSAPSSRFRVLAEDRPGTSTTIFETVVERRDPVGWRDARVDLAAFTPIRSLTFELVPTEDDGDFAGLGIWANPTVIVPQRDPAQTNLILISLDTLRADRLSLYGYPVATSPRIDAWAKSRGIVFLNTVAVSPRTLPSHVSMLTGLDALSHGVNQHGPAPLELLTLAETLRGEGYTTVASTGGGLAGPAFGLAQGFDEFYSYPGWPGGFEELETELQHTFGRLETLADRPFFLFFHTYEIHDPYQERAPYSDRCYSEGDERDFLFGALPRPRRKEEGYLLHHDLVKWRRGDPNSSAVPVGEDELALVSCLYDSGIAYADAQIQRLFDRLAELDLLESSMIVLTSDHGEALGEHGLFKHASLYEENLMIPLVLSLPADEYRGRVVEAQVSTIDIVPTILDVLGVELEAQMDGESLLPLVGGQDDGKRREAWSYAGHENRGVSLRIDNRVKYIVNNSALSSAFGREELFRLQADPMELDNLAGEDLETMARLRKWVRAFNETRSSSTRAVFENRSCERLTGAIELGGLTTAMKAFTQPEGGLSPDSDHRGALKLERGDRVETFIESNRKLTLRLRAEGCDPNVPEPEISTSLDLGALDESWSLTASGEGWSETRGEVATESPAVVRVSVEPPSRFGGNRVDAVDEKETLEQLRSLGYIQ